ncbi:hypothetical protein PI124_g11179 [Phytophthora idaei]|nr:hypothetical protein PI125_g10400 [Phytophthora idaei]KAG3154301.1 hypothetical protein PI126_g9689 [Phytophthora idaei]KAG3244033.1 hypothetical protein PI124_g11179 [Phytophthora idaei]
MLTPQAAQSPKTPSIDHYTTRYGGMQACIEILDTITKCNPVLDYELVFDLLPEGHYTTRAFITDNDRVVRYHLTNPVSFSIVDDANYAAHTAKLVAERRKTLQVPKDMNLLEWAQQQNLQHSQGTDDFLTTISDSQLVIGVKTAVLTNFARRQAIRETWGQRAKHLNVQVIFLGCVPIMSDIPNEADRKRLRDAVKMERTVYRDLLTEELECEDSYRNLANKVKAFFNLAATMYLQTPYVMLADDDIYLQVDKLLRLLEDFSGKKPVYLGQSWNSIYTRKSAPVREESHQSNLPKAQYPLSELPPFAFGPHYVVSMDCARFISKNYWRLRSLNGLEDVSVGLWLLTMQEFGQFMRICFTENHSAMATTDSLGALTN